MNWHIIEGEAGCRFAREHRCVAIIVDALRASATAAALLANGAREIFVTDTVERALELKSALPDHLLFGERGGLPPKGFDFGNSPQTVAAAYDRDIIFTTTTGAQRLIQAWPSSAILMGSTVNATAAVQTARRLAEESGGEVVVIPAGLATDPDFFAQEDWAAGAWLLHRASELWPGDCSKEGAAEFARWQDRIMAEGLPALFATAPHAEKLRQIGLESDIAFCAKVDLYEAVPMAVQLVDTGIVLMKNASHRGWN